MLTTKCPDKETLLQFSAGWLSEANVNALAEHFDACAECQATLLALDDADDTLIERLLSSPENDACLAEPQYQAAFAKVLRMPLAKQQAAEEPDAASRSASILPRTLGEYQVLEELGRGGMGRVYKARHTKLNRVVAVKLLARPKLGDPQAISRFEREMQAIGLLDHPNIVQAYDAREIDDMPVLIMEFIDGLDLAELVRRAGPLPVADACELVRRTALALQYAHEHGLVHRDIKPSNIMLSKAGEVKLLDLGLARFYVEAVAGEEMTGSGQAMGTADYMAPEQASDSRTVDIRADIYSLGCTLYKLLSDRAPFSGPDYRGTLDKLNAHVRETPPSIRQFVPDLPDELAKIIERMLAKNPADRFATPAEVASALEHVGQVANLPEGGRDNTSSRQVGNLPHDEADLPELINRAITLPRESWAKAEKSQDANFFTPRTATAPNRRRPVVRNLLIGMGFLGAMAACFAAGILITIKREGKPDSTIEAPEGSKVNVNQQGDVKIELPPGEDQDYTLIDLWAKDKKATLPPEPYKIAIGDFLYIRAAFTIPEMPIDGIYRVEPKGTVALGPAYGRVKIDGMSLAEAEPAIRTHLLAILKNPDVSVTLAGWKRQTPGTTPPQPHRIAPGDILNMWAGHALVDQPIHGPFLVESDGQVTLGPAYGRVNLKGLTFEEAEEATRKKLAEVLRTPDVSITIEGWRNTPDEWRKLINKPRSEQPKETKKTGQTTSTGQTPESQVQFGPVIERVVNVLGEDKGGEALVFHTGKVIDVPKEFLRSWPPERQRQWVTDNNIDLFIEDIREQQKVRRGILFPQSMKLAAVDNRLWDSGGEQDLRKLVETLTPGHIEGGIDTAIVREERGDVFYNLFYDLTQPPPLAFAFQTRNGDFGILQVIRFTEEPRGMRIRYKLVQQLKQNTDLVTGDVSLADAIMDLNTKMASEMRGQKVPAIREDQILQNIQKIINSEWPSESHPVLLALKSIQEKRKLPNGFKLVWTWDKPSAPIITVSLRFPQDQFHYKDIEIYKFIDQKIEEDTRGTANRLNVKRETPTTFRTAKITRGDITATITETGTIEPEEVQDIAAQVSGRIVNFGPDPRGKTDPKFKGKFVDYNTPVEQGDLLAALDPTEYQTRLDNAKSSLDQARAELEQAVAKHKLAESELNNAQISNQKIPGTIPPTQINTLATNVTVAKAAVAAAEASFKQTDNAVKEAERNLAYTKITSPINGVIIARRVNIGQHVTPDAKNSLFLIAKDFDKMEVWASVNEADIARIREGMNATFTVDALPNEVFHGKVTQIRLNAQMNQTVVTFTVVITFDNPDKKLLPYMTANVRLEVDSRKNVLLVPNAALRWKPDNDQIGLGLALEQGAGDRIRSSTYLWVKDETGKHVVPVEEVQIGLTDGTMIEVSGPNVKEEMELVIGDDRPVKPSERLPKIIERKPATQPSANPPAVNPTAPNPSAFTPTPSSLSHIVPFKIGATRFENGDQITIDEVRGTADTMTPGNLYEIKGTYRLASRDEADLAALATVDDSNPKSNQPAGVPWMKTQYTIAKRGEGKFSLVMYMWSEGKQHLSFCSGGKSIGSIYFGTGDSVLDHSKQEDNKNPPKTEPPPAAATPAQTVNPASSPVVPLTAKKKAQKEDLSAEWTRLFQEAAKLKPDDAEARARLAGEMTKVGIGFPAIDLLREALKINPDLAEAHNNLGYALLQPGMDAHANMKEALQHFERALQLKPDYAEAHNNLALALIQEYGRDRAKEAIEHYRQALKLKPNDPEINYNLGIAYSFTGEHDKSIEQLKLALGLKPDNPDAYFNMAVMLAKVGRLTEAIDAYHQAIRLNPNHFHYYDNLSEAYSRLNRMDEAIAAAEKGLEIAKTERGLSDLLEVMKARINSYRALQSLFKRSSQKMEERKKTSSATPSVPVNPAVKPPADTPKTPSEQPAPPANKPEESK